MARKDEWPERLCKHAIGVCPHCPDPDEDEGRRDELLEEARKALKRVVRILVETTRRNWPKVTPPATTVTIPDDAIRALQEFDRAGDLCYEAETSPPEWFPEEWYDACEAIAGLVVPWLARDIAIRYKEERNNA